MNRRQFLKAFGQVTAAYVAAGVGLYHYGSRVEAGRISVEKVRVPLHAMNPALEGFRVVQLSDIHVDSYTQIELVQEAVAVTNSLKPDLVVLTGDYVQHQAEAVFDLIPALTPLQAKYGIFAILGNHEYWTNADVVRTGLEQAGFPVLVNQGVTLGIGKGSVYLAGLDDVWSGQPNLNETLQNWRPGSTTILLAHEPDFADTVARDGRVSLQLSGHSHGGQVRLPGFGAVILPPYGQKYDQGLYNLEVREKLPTRLWLYTNRGVGLGPVSYRINCPPEVTEITLIGT